MVKGVPLNISNPCIITIVKQYINIFKKGAAEKDDSGITVSFSN